MDALDVVLGPDLGTHETQAHLDQTMVEMDQDHVVAPLGHFVIEGDRPDHPGVGMGQSLRAPRPGSGEGRHLEYGSARRSIEFDGFQGWLVRQRQARDDGLVDPFRREVEVVTGLVQAFTQSGDALLQLAFGSDVPLRLLAAHLRLAGVQFRDLAFDQTRHLGCDDGIDAPHVLPHGVEFPERTDDVVPVTTDGRIGVAAVDRVPNQDLFRLLSMAVDTAVALLHHVGVVGYLQVDQHVAVVLEVDALGSGIGGQQDADLGVPGVGLEGGLHLLTLVLIHATMENGESITVASCGQDLVEPLVGGTVFGEEDDSPIVPFAIRLEVFFDPVDDGARLGIGSMALALGPSTHLVDQFPLAIGQRWTVPAGHLDGLLLGTIHLGVVGIVLLGLLDRLAQDSLLEGSILFLRYPTGQGGVVLLQGGGEGSRWGEEPFLEQAVHEPGPGPGPASAGLFTAPAVFVEQAVDAPLLLGVGDGQRLEIAPGVQRISLGIHQVCLQPPHHDLRELLLVRQDVLGETLVVEQLEQRGEGLRVAVVWGRGEEQVVLEVGRQQFDQSGA